MTIHMNGFNRRVLAGMSLMALMISGCGSKFQSLNSTAANDPQNTQTGQPPGTGTSNTNWQNLSVSGKLGSGRFTSKQVLTLDKQTKELIVTLPLPANPNIDGVSAIIPIAKVPGMSVRVDPMLGGGTQIVLRVPLAALVKGIDFPTPATLPNGDPLPSVASGHMPAFAVTIPNVKNTNLTVYLDVQSVGVFINTQFDPMIYLSFPIRSDDGTRTWGFLTSIPAKQSSDGGFFISIQLPDDIARIIDSSI